jgi:molybdopterin molybdotransferase
MPLLSLAEAQARALALARPLPRCDAPLLEAAGRWLVASVTARVDHPFADLSAMDGYAIQFDDLPGPWRVVGDIPAGTLSARAIAGGEAMRIFTGAALPPGADTILIQEDASRDGSILRLTGDGPARRGQYVRARGGGFRAGEIVLQGGAQLTPARIGLAALAGHATLPVRARPRIALLSTGDELAQPGAAPRAGQIRDANGPMLEAYVSRRTANIGTFRAIPDQPDALRAAIREAASASDILVLTGGASVGDHDLVRAALEAEGAAIDFWRVAMKPGKPVMAGRLGDTVVLGLPGNPVSAFVTAFLFVQPLIAALGGAADPLPKPVRLPLAASVPANGARLEFLRATLEDGAVRPLAGQESHDLSVLAAADALILREPHAPPADAGTFADVHLIA